MPRLPLSIFAACSIAVLAMLGWATHHTLRLENLGRTAQAEAALQESVRLALWRMDSNLAPLIGREAARPYFHYQSFHAADRAYTRMWQEVTPGDVLVPSPLLIGGDPSVRLYFQQEADGRLTSPQVPTGNMRDVAESAYVPSSAVIAAEARLGDLDTMLTRTEARRVIVERCQAVAVSQGDTAGGMMDLAPTGTFGSGTGGTPENPIPLILLRQQDQGAPGGAVPAQQFMSQTEQSEGQSLKEYAARQLAQRQALSQNRVNNDVQAINAPAVQTAGAVNTRTMGGSGPQSGTPASAGLQYAGVADRSTGTPAPVSPGSSSTAAAVPTPLEAAPPGALADGDSKKDNPPGAPADPGQGKDSRSTGSAVEKEDAVKEASNVGGENEVERRKQVADSLSKDKTARVAELTDSKKGDALRSRGSGPTDSLRRLEAGLTNRDGQPPASELSFDAERFGPWRDGRSGDGYGKSYPPPQPTVEQGELTSVWLRDAGQPELLLVRSVRLGESEVVQGAWLDWPVLRGSLLGSIADLLPGAGLMPIETAIPTPGASSGAGETTPGGGGAVASASAANLARTLAGIPAELTLPDGLRERFAAPAAWTPARTALLLTWTAVLAAIVAIGRVLLVSIELAERRGRFVSAVTHELRTPLTTFCLYSQMLADGMVTDEEGRREYLATLKGESQRLAGIVENVLAFARLSRSSKPSHTRNGGSPGHAARLVLAELLEHTTPALRRRASEAGLELAVSCRAQPETVMAADMATVERIIFNLVDNAAKYAGGDHSAEGCRTIELSCEAAPGGELHLFVADSGPGVPPGERKRIFEPFTRGEAHADSPTQGLGLGLALSRGLARQLRGDLVLLDSPRGARFRLSLPLAPSRA